MIPQTPLVLLLLVKLLVSCQHLAMGQVKLKVVDVGSCHVSRLIARWTCTISSLLSSTTSKHLIKTVLCE